MGEHEIAKAMLDNVAEAAALVEQAVGASAPAPPPGLAEKPAATS
jgi:hypothetical protein